MQLLIMPEKLSLSDDNKVSFAVTLNQHIHYKYFNQVFLYNVTEDMIGTYKSSYFNKVYQIFCRSLSSGSSRVLKANDLM